MTNAHTERNPVGRQTNVRQKKKCRHVPHVRCIHRYGLRPTWPPPPHFAPQTCSGTGVAEKSGYGIKYIRRLLRHIRMPNSYANLFAHGNARTALTSVHAFTHPMRNVPGRRLVGRSVGRSVWSGHIRTYASFNICMNFRLDYLPAWRANGGRTFTVARTDRLHGGGGGGRDGKTREK